ncbi:glycosyltransferase [Arthrobacter sp. TMN-49]
MKAQNLTGVDVDFGPKMALDPKARMAEIQQLGFLLNAVRVAEVGSDEGQLAAGVSIIIPSWRGEDRLIRCLTSVVEQSVDPELLEIIVVVNGQRDKSIDLLNAFSQNYPKHRIRIFYVPTPSAGAARNLGIAAASREYTTFVDDDDYVGPKFIEEMLRVALPDRIAVSPIVNVSSEGVEDSDNALNTVIRSKSLLSFPLNSVPVLLGFNACKLIPTNALRGLRYSRELKSGEDICFMSSIAVSRNYQAQVGTIHPDGAYYRVLRDDSISRQELAYDFAVDQRLAVISQLEQMRAWDEGINDNLLVALSNSQAGFVSRYLDGHPEELKRIENSIDHHAIQDFPWKRLNAGKARDLVVSYCFAPYSDTSAVVAAKAIVERGRIVDVISNSMTGVRRIDSSLNTIAGRLIDGQFEVKSSPSFAGWAQISEFVRKGIVTADRQDARIDGYRTLYSRVLWPGSHFLAALFKLKHPKVVWTAEFSDPVSTDASGAPRSGELIRDDLFALFNRAVAAKGYRGIDSNSIFEWCEYVTYVLSDEVLFTNTNQRDYMLSKIADKKLRNLVLGKSRVRHHPVPPARSYSVVPSQYTLSESTINIGYFGAFYDNRGLTDVLTALMNTPSHIRRKIRLHVFTNRAEEFGREVAGMGLIGNVLYQGYLPYLEFLNLSTRFDVLMVNDVERGTNLDINPFLPSKFSDYKGSGAKIWGVLDEGSALSRMELDYTSVVGNSASALNALSCIYEDLIGLSR